MAIIITHVLIDEDSIAYLKSRRLIAQYSKAKRYLISEKHQQVDLKIREPKEQGIWYFRINRQYRAHCTYRDGALRVHKIDNHSR